MKTEQGQQYHQHAIAMAILCLAPDDRSEPDTGNALSWLRSIEWVASPKEPLTPQGYSFEEAMDHYPDAPPEPKKTTMCMEFGNTPGNPEPSSARMCMDDFPDGLLGTWWSYWGREGRAGQVTKHEGDCVEVDYPTSTDCIDVEWLFKAYTYVPAPTQEDA